MKIYNVFVGRYGARWLEKTDDERGEMFSCLKRAFEKSGGRGLITCEAVLSCDSNEGFSMDEFPDIKAFETYRKELRAVEWDRHFDGYRLVGTPVDGFENVNWQIGEKGETEQVYKLWMMQGTPAYHTASDAERKENLERTNTALKQAGGRRLLVCHPLNNQHWFLFGIEVFPSMGNAMAFQMDLSKNGTTKFSHSWIYICRPWENFANITVTGTPE